jgi:hypothetical protein
MDPALCTIMDNSIGHGVVYDWSLIGVALEKGEGR